MKTIFLFIAMMAIIGTSCKVQRNIQKNRLQVDSTVARSERIVNMVKLRRQASKNRVDSSYNNRQDEYQRQTVIYQFARYTGSPANYVEDTISDMPVNIPKTLHNRLTQITVTTEKGKQATQTGNISNHTTDWLSVKQDSTSKEKQEDITLTKKQEAKETEKTSTGTFAGWIWALFALLFIGGVLDAWKGWGIVGLVSGWGRKKKIQ
jgi:hypothetical protein